jgi:hypothetical protein
VLLEVYLDTLRRMGTDLSDVATLAELFLGDRERRREVEETLAWLATRVEAPEDTEVRGEAEERAIEPDDLLLDDHLLIANEPPVRATPPGPTTASSDRPRGSEDRRRDPDDRRRGSDDRRRGSDDRPRSPGGDRGRSTTRDNTVDFDDLLIAEDTEEAPLPYEGEMEAILVEEAAPAAVAEIPVVTAAEEASAAAEAAKPPRRRRTRAKPRKKAEGDEVKDSDDLDAVLETGEEVN